MEPSTLYPLPDDLPVPVDDGACDHLPGLHVPSVGLAATDGTTVALSNLPGTIVIYCYPRTGPPNGDIPKGWDDIPAARGCTPQSIAFRDHFQELRGLDVRVFGMSTQTTDYQREVAVRLHLPFPLLSDDHLALTRALRLPTFTVEGMELVKRLTLIVRDGVIEHVFYPVFPPDRNAGDVVEWLRQQPAR